MKILYAIQGTGNGHLSRAIAILPFLFKRGEVDILISGNESQINFPYPVKYYCYGLTFAPSMNGGIDLIKTIKRVKPKRFINEVKSLPVTEYDLVISDFEPISAWACKYRGLPCVELSHQAAVRMTGSPQTPLPFPLGRWIIKNYCPSSKSIGFHFESFTENTFYPLIRKEILSAKPTLGEHTLVYLTAYSKSFLVDFFSKLPGVFHIYIKDIKEIERSGNIVFYPIGSSDFLEDLITSNGVVCGAGFELPSEALFLNKKLLVIPYSNHYEQHCNAQALKKIGATVIFDLNKNAQLEVLQWCEEGKIVNYHWRNQLEIALDRVFEASALGAEVVTVSN